MKRILPVLLLAASSAVLAESGAYRVEVIVFRNLAATAEARASETLRSFSKFPDLQDKRQADDTPAKPPVMQTLEPVDLTGAALTANLPDDLLILDTKSGTMDDVWRRLRSSQTYRPLIYAAWQQNRVDYYPPMRIHDQQVIDTQLRPPTRIMVADLTEPDPLAVYRSTFYQLDGSLQLRRSRFLHLFLDLEYRENMPQGEAVATFPDDIAPGPGPVVVADTRGLY
ncbi:MAG: CsiV family protein, partial [Lysobacterales bacterium]